MNKRVSESEYLDIPRCYQNSPENKEQEFNACAASHVDCKFGSSVTALIHAMYLISGMF